MTKRTLQDLLDEPRDGLTTSQSIGIAVQLAYDEQLELDMGAWQHLHDHTKTSLQKLQAASDSASQSHDSTPFDSPLWSKFPPSLADAIVDFTINPHTFNPARYDNIVKVSSIPDGPSLRQVFYTRRLPIGPEAYATKLEAYAHHSPYDIAFAMLNLQYLGFGKRAESLFSSVMAARGYSDAVIKLDPRVEGIHPNSQPTYSGSTSHSASGRDKQDKAQSPGSRMTTFMQLNSEVEWDIIEWANLQEEIPDRLEWRRTDVGQREAVLTDCIVPNLNMARGGFVHEIQLPPSHSIPLARLLAMSPPHREGDSVPADMSTDLVAMVLKDYHFAQTMGEVMGVEEVYGQVAVDHVVKEFVQAIKVVNGSVSSITITRDLPQEAGRGRIDTSLGGNEVGRAVALHQRIMQAIHALEHEIRLPYRHIRDLEGPFLDFWRFFEYGHWWGLLVLVLGIYLRRLRPYVIHTWSTSVSAVFDSALLYRLPRELGQASLQGPAAMEAIDANTLAHPAIVQTRYARYDRNFHKREGVVRIVRYGPDGTELANHLAKGDPGSPFYRQVFFRHDKRRFALLNGLSVALTRFTDEQLFLKGAPETEEDTVAFLQSVQAAFHKAAVDSGVQKVLDDEHRLQRICDQAEAALVRKKAPEEGTGETQRVGGEEPEKKKRRIERVNPRNNGILALGEPHSSERLAQLTGLRNDARIAVLLGQNAEVLWFEGLTASDPEFEPVFLNLKQNHSLQQSINAHGRTPAGIQGHLDNGKKLAMHNKDLYSKLRQDRGDAVGSWIQAEQFEEMCIVLPTLELDLSFQSFHDSPRTAVCQDCGERVFGKDRNSTHRCSVDAVRTKISKTSFNKYSRLLHPHHLLDQTDVDGTVHQRVINHFDLKASPALDWVIDDNGESTLPFPADIERVTGTVYWKKNEPKHSAVNFHLATDVALRSLAPGDTPLEMAQRAGKTIQPGAEKRFNDDQDKVWTQAYMDKVVRDLVQSDGELDGCICLGCGDVKLECKGASRLRMMIHGPCTRSGNKSHGRNEENFLWFSPQRLTDLPYSLSTVLLYRATRGSLDPVMHRLAREAKGKKPKKKEGGEKAELGIDDWRVILDWGR